MASLMQRVDVLEGMAPKATGPRLLIRAIVSPGQLGAPDGSVRLSHDDSAEVGAVELRRNADEQEGEFWERVTAAALAQARPGATVARVTAFPELCDEVAA